MGTRKHYSNYLNRANVVVKNVEKLLDRIDELEEANRKLRDTNSSLLDLARARERVLKDITDKYAPELNTMVT